ncbi:hypothetical protein Ais01nite_06870 [Asanoa ishikariensis]|uniref:Uncharacterized protein n=1 Tax=Asanoa ishikariensis TaxID=137265 RepID=A0A1H3TD89_9ACTN|nr:hypothetical protein [Asanoa ishikariensis]GIF62652.1 hypothetical protein Ais01nite_06870 [Asanoa ishikariensis]SDZ48176.1 hypothetical protein SAMN05421684_5548 [Asanoa ishikariensis]
MSLGEVTEAASAVAVAMGIIVAAATLAATRMPLAALAVLLDFLMVAGVLHLAADPTYLRAASAGIVLAVRHLITWSLQTGSRGLFAPMPQAPGRAGKTD